MTPPPRIDDALRHLVELERLLAREDAAADLEAGQRAAVRAGREHDVGAAVEVVADGDRAVGASRRPSPATTVMPRAFMSPCSPLNFFATMPSR